MKRPPKVILESFVVIYAQLKITLIFKITHIYCIILGPGSDFIIPRLAVEFKFSGGRRLAAAGPATQAARAG